jgi:hypothetical protein
MDGCRAKGKKPFKKGKKGTFCASTKPDQHSLVQLRVPITGHHPDLDQIYSRSENTESLKSLTHMPHPLCLALWPWPSASEVGVSHRFQTLFVFWKPWLFIAAKENTTGKFHSRSNLKH